MQALHLQQSQTLRQEQILAPQQIQSLEILLAALPELEQKIEAELVENPTLELLDPGNEDLAGNPVEQNDSGNEFTDSADSALSQKLEDVIHLHNLWQDRMPVPVAGAGRGRFSEDDEERRQFFFDSLVSEPSVQENLLLQLQEIGDLDEKSEEVCREIIGSIDDRGYLRTHPADIAIACGLGDIAEVEKCLNIVQSFDPPGIGARDLRECLLLQLERRGEKGTLAYRVIDKHLEELGKNRLDQVCKRLRTSPATLRDALHIIRRLHPHPGALIAPDQITDFVSPEIFIEKNDDGEWTVRTNRESIPRLRISPYYLQMLSDDTTPDEVKDYIRRKIGNSRMLMRALEQRESTIVRIAKSLLKCQIGFFEEGIAAMRPLTMAQVAADIDVHETTVSRAIANKYMMTPHGILPFRHFFTTGYTTSEGEEVSSLVIKDRLRHLVDTEPASKPLSDQRLADLLEKEGYQVARRTVAKYREEMGIPTSSLRRQF